MFRSGMTMETTIGTGVYVGTRTIMAIPRACKTLIVRIDGVERELSTSQLISVNGVAVNFGRPGVVATPAVGITGVYR